MSTGPAAAPSHLLAWLDGVRHLHLRAGRGLLSHAERLRYLDDRRQLLAGLLAAENRRLAAGQLARRSLRVANAVPVALSPLDAGRPVNAITLDLSTTGFSTLVAVAPRPGDRFVATLRLPGGAVVEGEAVAANARARSGAPRIGFRLERLSVEAREVLEAFVAGVALARLEG